MADRLDVAHAHTAVLCACDTDVALMMHSQACEACTREGQREATGYIRPQVTSGWLLYLPSLYSPWDVSVVQSTLNPGSGAASSQT